MVLDLMILSVGFRFTYKIGCVEKFLPILSLLYVMLPSSIKKHLLAARVIMIQTISFTPRHQIQDIRTNLELNDRMHQSHDPDFS